MDRREKIQGVVTAIIICSAAIFFLSTIREGHDWGGDFSMYIHHAKNITEGRDYSDTGYIVNPGYVMLAPQNYPPVFPLILSPVYRFCGLDLECMKREIILFFVLAMVLAYLVFRRYLRGPLSLAALALLAFNPVFWEYKDQVLSDIPFMFFCLAALLLSGICDSAYQDPGDQGPGAERYGAGQRSGYSLLACGAAAGAVIYLAYGTRSIGAVLLAAFFISDYMRNRRLTRSSFAAAVVFAAAALAQNALIHAEGSYAGQFKGIVHAAAHNAAAYPRVLLDFWDNGRSQPAALVPYGLFSILAVAGFLARIRHRPSAAEFFVLLYMAVLLIYPGYGGMRYLIPILPLYVLYAFIGIDAAVRARAGRSAVAALVIAAAAVTYISSYTAKDYGPVPEGPETAASAGMFDYIKSSTGKDDIVIFRKPRVMALYGGRESASYQLSPDREAIGAFVDSIGASYIVSGPFSDDRTYLEPFISGIRGRLEPVFSNSDFTVYRIGRATKPGTGG